MSVPSGVWDFDELALASELQTPLLGIAANARVASSRLSGSDAKVAEYLEAIEFSSAGLIKTIDVLVRSRNYDNESLSLELEPVHVGLSVEQVISKLEPLCRVQAQILNVQTKKNTIVTANKDCLELALYHIFEQALRSSATEEIIGVSLVQSGDFAKINVKASGGRERATTLRNALKAYSKSGSKLKFGVNFSLAASQKLIEVMGGALTITQRRDGVSFLIKLPVSRQGELLFE